MRLLEEVKKSNLVITPNSSTDKASMIFKALLGSQESSQKEDRKFSNKSANGATKSINFFPLLGFVLSTFFWTGINDTWTKQ